MTTPYPKTCALLKRNRIDPSRVSVDGFGHNGYFVFTLDVSGNRVSDRSGIRPKRDFTTWPSVEFAKQAVETFLEEGGRAT